MSIKLYHHWDFSDSTREMRNGNKNKRKQQQQKKQIKKNKNIHLKMVIGNKIRRNEEWFKT